MTVYVVEKVKVLFLKWLKFGFNCKSSFFSIALLKLFRIVGEMHYSAINSNEKYFLCVVCVEKRLQSNIRLLNAKSKSHKLTFD